MALCVIGAWQIGKTTLIREFGRKNYAHFVEVNFVTDPGAAKIFNGSLDTDTLITNLSAYTRKPMEPGKTLVLFDEAKECPKVRTAIKFLVEDGRFDYIESESLLGVRHKEVRSYPVGLEDCTPVSQAVHDTMNKLFSAARPISFTPGMWKLRPVQPISPGTW